MNDASGGTAVLDFRPLRPGLVAGIGLRSSATEGDVIALIDFCLAKADKSRADIVALASIATKASHPALLAAARTLGVPVVPLVAQNLSGPAPNPSTRVAAHIGLPSVAEAAALAFGPLVVEKQRGGTVTCALSRYTSPANSRARIAASTLATSSAGP